MLWGLALFFGKVLILAWSTFYLNPTCFTVIFFCEAWISCFRNICCRHPLSNLVSVIPSYFVSVTAILLGHHTMHRPKIFQIFYFPFLPTAFSDAYSNVLSMWWAFMLWQHRFIRCSSTTGLVFLITVLRNGLLFWIVWI